MYGDKQPADVKYLSNEVNELRSEIHELREMNKLNRQVIELLSEKNPNSRLFIDVIRTVCREVGEQSAKISKLVDERNEMNAKVLVFEKIMEQAQDTERLANEAIREQIDSLQKYVDERELKIKNYEEKVGEVDYLSSLVTKYVNISLPSEQALHFNKEIEELNELILFQKDCIDKINLEKDGLMKINLALKNEIERKNDDIVRIKEQSFAAQSFIGMSPELLEQSTDKQASPFRKVGGGINFSAYAAQNEQRARDSSFSFLKFQKTIIEEESDSDFDPDNLCPELSVMFPDKVERINNARSRSVNMPRLKMDRVRQLMKKNRSKIDSEMKKNAHVNPTEKIIMYSVSKIARLENQLDFTRRELSKCILEQKAMQEDRDRHTSLIKELESRNDLLLAGYNKFKDMWQRIYKQYFAYRQLYEQCQHYMQTEQNQNLQATNNSVFGNNLSAFVASLEERANSHAQPPKSKADRVSSIAIELYSRPNRKPERPKSLD